MNSRYFGILLSFAGLMWFISCSKEKAGLLSPVASHYDQEDFHLLSQTLKLPEVPFDYQVMLPGHFRVEEVDFPEITNDAATLGRVLFYDKSLSANNEVACASCHFQDRAFSDPVAFSKGFEGKLTKRNAFALGAIANASATYGANPFTETEGALFWDNRVKTAAEQIRQTLQDSIEMGADLAKLPAELQQTSYYPILFQQAFGSEQITEDRIVEALSQFTNSILTINSRFDQGFLVKKNAFPLFDNFTPEENSGKLLFIENCSTCHGSVLARSLVSHTNNGIDLVYQDSGMGALNGQRELVGVFKVPMLRNIELTGPYMHDGRFTTLEEVIEHYSTGIQLHENLDPFLREKGPDGQERAKQMGFTEKEKKALIAFLKTFTDQQFLGEKKYSDPFKK